MAFELDREAVDLEEGRLADGALEFGQAVEMVSVVPVNMPLRQIGPIDDLPNREPQRPVSNAQQLNQRLHRVEQPGGRVGGQFNPPAADPKRVGLLRDGSPVGGSGRAGSDGPGPDLKTDYRSARRRWGQTEAFLQVAGQALERGIGGIDACSRLQGKRLSENNTPSLQRNFLRLRNDAEPALGKFGQGLGPKGIEAKDQERGEREQPRGARPATFQRGNFLPALACRSRNRPVHKIG